MYDESNRANMDNKSKARIQEFYKLIKEMLPSEISKAGPAPHSADREMPVDSDHECVVCNGADGNDGIWLKCRSCEWTSDDFCSPIVRNLVDASEAHRSETRRTDEGSAAAIRSKFIQELVALGFCQANAPGGIMALDRGAIRAWIGWERAALGTIKADRCLSVSEWVTFDEARAYLARLTSGFRFLPYHVKCDGLIGREEASEDEIRRKANNGEYPLLCPNCHDYLDGVEDVKIRVI